MREHKKGFYEKYIKRPLDFLLALSAFIVLSPVMFLVAVLVRMKLGSPVIFKQARPGMNEKIFYMYKFRSMTDEKDENGNLLPDEVRLTEFGKKLRRTSLDELPELINIIKGDMSIVGPRPQLVQDMVFMTPEQKRRHEVRQGLTGLAQIHGRNAIEWEEKLEYDVKYIEHITFIDDVRIIGKTVKAVFEKEGINAEGMVTAEDYGAYLLRVNNISREIYMNRLTEANNLIKEQKC